MERGAALHRHLQAELALFGNALGLAHQPLRLQAHGHLRGERRGAEVGAHRHRHRQQHRALVAVVRQVPDRNLARHRPVDLAGGQAGGQRPPQRGRQAGIARVLPVGVPLRLVGQAQPQPHRLARRYALGRMGQQPTHPELLSARRRLASMLY